VALAKLRVGTAGLIRRVTWASVEFPAPLVATRVKAVDASAAVGVPEI
jgi:hypothetical protein